MKTFNATLLQAGSFSALEYPIAGSRAKMVSKAFKLNRDNLTLALREATGNQNCMGLEWPSRPEEMARFLERA